MSLCASPLDIQHIHNNKNNDNNKTTPRSPDSHGNREGGRGRGHNNATPKELRGESTETRTARETAEINNDEQEK